MTQFYSVNKKKIALNEKSNENILLLSDFLIRYFFLQQNMLLERRLSCFVFKSQVILQVYPYMYICKYVPRVYCMEKTNICTHVFILTTSVNIITLSLYFI